MKNGWLKQLLDFAPLLVFFVFYKWQDIFYASGALIVATWISVVLTWLIFRKVEKAPLITAVVVTIFGSLTIAFHSADFIKWKVTAIYAIFAAVLVGMQLFTPKTLIERMLGKELKMPAANWKKLNIAWVIFFVACALGNIYVAFSLSLETWVNFKVFGLSILTFLFTIASVVYIWNNRLPEPEEGSEHSAEQNLSDEKSAQAAKSLHHDADVKSK
ncbi:MAG TPA: septation protein A [Proteus sp.]|uniref:Inner membrane-spanning protein YciB n=1 Tax=Proteus hauseri ATCC 700826 TaxID=1354271 RepID=A0AAJ3HSU4_PROHU|nr:septation protein A [Proteus hauseri]OAT47297.1 intracellular septation protein [Proteus hauseri ATCC 700826]HCH50190.1 septation protein A [Proteus sp. (in: enterobacteria)]